MKHVVVIGAGFAGLMALKQMANSKTLKLALINKYSYFLFTPRLTELLNGSISKKIVIKEINSIFGNRVNFIQAEANYIDFKKRYVITGKTKVNYDYLIMAQGAATNFFGNKSIEKNTIGYKGYNAYLKIKGKIKSVVQKASKTNKKDILAFAVIGAGLTGIELICSLKEAVLEEIKRYGNISQKDAKFILIGASKDIASQLNKPARLSINKFLKGNKIEVITGARVEDIKKDVIIAGNKKIKASLIIWAAGVKANAIKTSPKLDLGKSGAIKVNNKLKIPGYDDVYVGGDVSLYAKNHDVLPQTAQVAWQEGICIGKNILRRINGKNEADFNYTFKGTLVVLGRKHGLYANNNIAFGGRIVWYFRHLFYKYNFWKIT